MDAVNRFRNAVMYTTNSSMMIPNLLHVINRDESMNGDGTCFAEMGTDRGKLIDLDPYGIEGFNYIISADYPIEGADVRFVIEPYNNMCVDLVSSGTDGYPRFYLLCAGVI
ncbi:hypothetical protein L596_026163 [Steinernema carpocapsae]|uniref:Uncharacterized protein n=1 Tax=Steinernema carpocapsae TaxID=34508 RepID=A0A4U5M0J8_STECR|nr:hypothetical protein L596_026163 [Steinernema carpocapsae]